MSASVLGLVVSTGGCFGRGSFDDPTDPAVRIPNFVSAARANDFDHAPELVAGLESDDPAVRLYAIGSLERLTGTTRGYVWYMEPEQNRESLDEWSRWLAGEEPDAVAGEVSP